MYESMTLHSMKNHSTDLSTNTLNSTVRRTSARLERLTSRKKIDWLNSSPQHGFVRLFAPAGSRSIVYPVSLETTVDDICSILGFEALYLQIGGLHIRRLASGIKPLQMQNDILTTIGYENESDCMQMGDATHITHVFCFYMGRPEHSIGAGTSNEILVTKCFVRKGKLLQKWVKHRCILYNGTIRIEFEGEGDEIIMLNRYRADIAESNRGKYLRLSEASHSYCFLFDAIGEMNLWLSRIVQTQMSPTCDLSDRCLLFLPDELFSVSVDRPIVSLNLRRNSLLLRPNSQTRYPPIGWLNDIYRLNSLRSLNIADNALYLFPIGITQVMTLTEVNLCGNRISSIPPQIGNLQNLIVLNLCNNWLTSLPDELAQCTSLSTLDLSFNRFEQVPEVLFALKKVSDIQLAGNEISSAALHALSLIHAKKLDLRRNVLMSSVRLTSFNFDALTEIDLRDNKNLCDLDFSNLPTIQIIHCERLRLNSLQINGSSLRCLYADHNELSHIVIMPIPIHLNLFSASYNKLSSLPDWLSDLPKIEVISAHNNLIDQLPYRIFSSVSSLKTLKVNDNQIEKLPESVENCFLEVLSLQNNRIDRLPNDLLRSAHRLYNLNVSHNQLTSLPPANDMTDLNRLQFLRAAHNKLDETVIAVIIPCRRLRILDLSYNNLRFFDDTCLIRLTALEDINLSSNCLTSISGAFGMLPNLQVLRLHSNRITTIPDLSRSPSLFLLDLSNNQLADINTDFCMAKTLKHLDLTCNLSLHVDTNDIRPKKTGRSVSIFDVGSDATYSFFQFGFSETTGQKNKLCIRQIRPKSNEQTVFGIVDGGSNEHFPVIVVEKLNDYLSRKKMQTEIDLKLALIRAHEELGQMGERLGASALLLKVNRHQIVCAYSGTVQAVLCRSGYAINMTVNTRNDTLTDEEYLRIRSGNATLTQENAVEGVCYSSRSLGFTFLYPAIVPNPEKVVIQIQKLDEFLIIASRSLWKILEPQQAVDLIRDVKNPQIAAKKLQDTVQSFEYTGNISVIVIRFKKREEIFQKNSFANRSNLIANCEDNVLASDASFKNSETTLRIIEERLEKISEAISKIEDDSTNNIDNNDNNNHINNSLSDINKYSDPIVHGKSEYSTVRRKKYHSVEDTFRKVEDRDHSAFNSTSGIISDHTIPSRAPSFGSRAPSSASAPPDPHSVDNTKERFSIRSRIDMFDRMIGFGTATSRERFQRARLVLGEQLKMETPLERQSRKCHF